MGDETGNDRPRPDGEPVPEDVEPLFGEPRDASSEPEDVKPMFGEPRAQGPARDEPAATGETDPSTALIEALDARLDALSTVSLEDGAVVLTDRVLDAQHALAQAALDYRLGFQTMSAALTQADVIIENRADAVEAAEIADFIVGLVQLGVLTAQGAKALAKLWTHVDEAAVSSAASTGALSSGAEVVDDVADTGADLTHTFAETDAAAKLADEFVPVQLPDELAAIHGTGGGWDPSVADDVAYYLSLSEKELEFVNAGMAQRMWGEVVNAEDLAALAARADTTVDAVRTRLSGQYDEVPDWRIVSELLYTVRKAEGWVIPERSVTQGLQTLAARTSLLADRGLKFTLTPRELDALRQVATDPTLAAGLEKIPLQKVLTIERELEPAFTAAEAGQIRALAEALYGTSGRATKFTLTHGDDAAEIIVSAASAPLTSVPVAELGSSIVAAHRGDRIVFVRTQDAGGFPGARFLTRAGQVLDRPVPFTEGSYVVVIADAVLDGGVIASAVNQFVALGLSGDETQVFETMPDLVPVLGSAAGGVADADDITIEGPVALTPDDLALVRNALSAAFRSAAHRVPITAAVLAGLQGLVDTHPGLLDALPQTTIRVGAVVAQPFTAEVTVWLGAALDSGGDPDALVQALGPVRVAGATKALDISGAVDMGSVVTTGVADAIDSITGGFDRGFILLGHRLDEGSAFSTSANLGVGMFTGPITSSQQVLFAPKLYDSMWTTLNGHDDVRAGMRDDIDTAIDSLQTLQTLATGGWVVDLGRDARELLALADEYQAALDGASDEWRAANGAEVEATIARLRLLAGPTLSTVEATQSLDGAGMLATDLQNRLTDPLDGSVRLWAPLEAPTLGQMAHSWNWTRNQLANSPLPPLVDAPTPAFGTGIDPQLLAPPSARTPVVASPAPDAAPEETVEADDDRTWLEQLLANKTPAAIALVLLLVMAGLGFVLTGGDGEATQDAAGAEGDGDDDGSELEGGTGDDDLSEFVGQGDPVGTDDPVGQSGWGVPDGGVFWTNDASPDPQRGSNDSEWQIIPGAGVERYSAFRVEFTPQQIERNFRNTYYPCGGEGDGYSVRCPIDAGSLSGDADTEFLIVAAQHDGPIAGDDAEYVYGLAFDDQDDTDDLIGQEPFPADLFHETERWYRYRVARDGSESVWADGFDGGAANVPRHSSVRLIVRDDALVWIVPASELPDGPVRYRVTAFADTVAEPGVAPDPATAGGDLGGTTVFDPMATVPDTVHELTDLDVGLVDIEGTGTVDVPADADAFHVEQLTADLVERTNDALDGDDPVEGMYLLVHPQVRTVDPDRCRQVIADTVGQGLTVRIDQVQTEPQRESGIALFSAVGEIGYPNGPAAWGPILVPGPDGHFRYVIPSCLPAG